MLKISPPAPASAAPASSPAAAENPLGGIWRDFFHRWPGSVPQRGVIVTTFDEQVPFSSFLVNDSVVFVDRTHPDTSGARQLLIPFTQIAALKIVDVVDKKHFEAVGFRNECS